ncbi:MAG: hypothetical protein ACK5LC_05885, partial [Coprobacillaceae bacterium]
IGTRRAQQYITKYDRFSVSQYDSVSMQTTKYSVTLSAVFNDTTYRCTSKKQPYTSVTQNGYASVVGIEQVNSPIAVNYYQGMDWVECVPKVYIKYKDNRYWYQPRIRLIVKGK